MEDIAEDAEDVHGHHFGGCSGFKLEKGCAIVVSKCRY